MRIHVSCLAYSRPRATERERGRGGGWREREGDEREGGGQGLRERQGEGEKCDDAHTGLVFSVFQATCYTKREKGGRERESERERERGERGREM